MHTMQSVKGCNLSCKDTLFIILLKKNHLVFFFPQHKALSLQCYVETAGQNALSGTYF